MTKMADKVLCLFFLASTGLVTGILVGPVKLLNKGAYITYQKGPGANLTVLECPVELQKDEVLQKVTWIFSDGKDTGSYTWETGSGGEATGRLEGVVRLDRQDGNLQLTALRYDLAGFYSCSATEQGGKTAETAPWELLVIDTTANSRVDNLDISEGNCKFKSTLKVAPVFPEPTVHSGLYSEKRGGFVEEVKAVEWYKQKYPNGSVAYSHENVVFELNRDAPFDVVFLNAVGVTKADGSYISLTATKTVLSDFTEHGCPYLKSKAYQSIRYNSDRRSCRDEILPPLTDSLKATVTCMDGYKPAGDVESLEMTCNPQTWEWDKVDDHSFMCVLGEAYGTEPGAAFTVSSSSLLLLICLALQRLRQQ